MTNIIAISNQKGGVGKTTTTVNLSAALAEAGQRTLVVDLDPQSNASSGLGFDPREERTTTYDILLQPDLIDDAILATEYENLWVLPATHDLAGAENELASELARESRLKQALARVSNRFDLILIDNPPTLNNLTVNALTAADYLLIPMQCEFYALEGLTQLLHTVKLVQQHLNSDLEIAGILLTMFDARNNICHQVAHEITEHFSWAVFEAVIPRNVRLSEAPSFGMPAIHYDPTARGSHSYRTLAKELLHRLHNSATT